MQEIICKNELETKKFAEKFASILAKGDVVVLTGELGAGKTKFVEGVLTHFNMQDEISSPTFTIVNEYRKDDINIFHFDVYRLSDSDEFLAIGGEEYFEKGISILEWGEIVEDVLPKGCLRIYFEKDTNEFDLRKLKIENKGTRFEEVNFNSFKE